ncbi:MAG: class I SAM-dependent methyltransferase [Clostridiales bacterium]|nr:class I SAM-dependent methyltransferase [Clostridiales bacterium]
MKEVDINKAAWSKISKKHYEHFKKQILNKNYNFNPIILDEIGDVRGKTILHLQCNTGADSIMLAKMGAIVTGVDLVPDNICYARRLAKDCGVDNIKFIESDIMTLMDFHHVKYDIVFTSDGVLLWIPDKKRWGETLRHCLKDDGYFYVHDSHPFYLIFDEEELPKGCLSAKYPYFISKANVEYGIGGYATETVKETTTYEWMYTIGDIINALSSAGLFIEYLNEYDKCVKGMANCDAEDENKLGYLSYYKEKIPLVFSLKATVR